MSELNSIIEQTANGVFGDNVSQQMLVDLEQGKLNPELWQTIDNAGLTRLLLPEALGGAGGSWLDAELVLRACGRHTVPAPVGEAIAAFWLLAQLAMPIPEQGVLSWASGREENGHVHLDNAPWAAQADQLLVWTQQDNFYLFGATSGLSQSKNIAGEPRASGSLDCAEALQQAPLPASLKGLQARTLGALVRSVQMSGALDGALHTSVNYARERVQFGKAIAQFQAIQQQLALMSGQVAMAVRAAGAGCEALNRDPASAAFDIAAAKVINSEAVEIATSVAHQVHAAIGITFEYRLNFFSRRLWSWRDEYGSESHWANVVGQAVSGQGGDALWPGVTDNSLRL